MSDGVHRIMVGNSYLPSEVRCPTCQAPMVEVGAENSEAATVSRYECQRGCRSSRTIARPHGSNGTRFNTQLGAGARPIPLKWV